MNESNRRGPGLELWLFDCLDHTGILSQEWGQTLTLHFCPEPAPQFGAAVLRCCIAAVKAKTGKQKTEKEKGSSLLFTLAQSTVQVPMGN